MQPTFGTKKLNRSEKTYNMLLNHSDDFESIDLNNDEI